MTKGRLRRLQEEVHLKLGVLKRLAYSSPNSSPIIYSIWILIPKRLGRSKTSRRSYGPTPSILFSF
ncbi:hypothetical protein CR513_61536, partial [Mucuna pruriens]